jgi:hypothetical protein
MFGPADPNTERRLPPPFPALCTLEMTASPLQCTQFIKMITSTSMESLWMCIAGNIAAQVQQCLSIVSQKFQALRSIHIPPYESFYTFIEDDPRLPKLYPDPEKTARRVSSSRLSMQTIDLLLACRELQDVVIEWPITIVVERADFLTMIEAWPDIERLSLTPLPFLTMPVQLPVTLTDLFCFAQCKHFTTLSVFVDASYREPDFGSRP